MNLRVVLFVISLFSLHHCIKSASRNGGNTRLLPQGLTLALDKLRGGAVAAMEKDPVAAFVNAVDLFGTGVFAFSGAVTAGKKGMDLLGMTYIAVIAAVGGGTVRDILLDSGTVFWLRLPIYFNICALTTLFTYLLWPTLESRLGWKDSAAPVCTADAFGLAAFAVIGTQKAVDLGLDPIVWPVVGLVTCTFGGITRDVICLQNPRVMYPYRTLYATAPLLGSVVYTLLLQKRFGLDTQLAATVSFMVTFTFRLLSFNRSWRLPHWKPAKDLTLGDTIMNTMTLEEDEDQQQYTSSAETQFEQRSEIRIKKM
mmetsp:Transcript_18415/g.25342  ORF Transcript_18415/g.25342 Transcript_18415/m.25342 type:complete len:312 (-) Transcript_18415:192-1127(-)